MSRMQLFHRSICAWLALLAAGAWASSAWAAEHPELDRLTSAIEAARAEQVDVLAPRNFARSVDAHQAAQRDVERGRNAERVRTRVAEAEAALERATRAATAARQLLSSVIKTREDALVAEAPKYAGELWARGSQRFRDAMIENETGDLKNAQKRAAE